ncbi:MAG TPA: phosphopantothenoylcysteine decarboxylase [Methylomirabilota bacterium]|nr:phosphopantothenoylcysteine decarboxylase [Methylomirabilota bacterium]
MKVVVTCGPAYEPIDEVRRLTNFSTGELGVLLADALTGAGWEVICFRGEAATCPRVPSAAECVTFSTNADLAARLRATGAAHDIGAVFHAAALCDYKVGSVEDSRGAKVGSPKIDSRAGELVVRLVPAAKVIASLRSWFPHGVLIGWKYELVGTRADALARARAQMAENRTDACVVNGRAFGPGFGLCEAGAEQPVAEFAGKKELVAGLVAWLKGRRSPPPKAGV